MEFGLRPLFVDANFVINKKDRIALVGKNGAGKSTLLKILAGLQQPTRGTVSVQRDVAIGYLPQVMKLEDGRTVLQEAEQAFGHLTELREHIAALGNELARRTDYESADYAELADRYARENDRYQMMGGTNYRAETERTLTGLGFEPADFGRPTSEFSGGWRMRIELAKLLLSRPDVLLLDEPTNHLDIESIAWLEQFLQHSNSAVVLVSHDRAFINNVTNRTIEITCGHIADYRVGYDAFVRLRAERREQQLRAYENQQKEVAELKSFIERFRYKPTKSNQVQSRIKQLEKIVPIEVDQVDTAYLHLKFPPCQRSGDYPLICDDVGKSYGEHVVFSHVSLTLKRGEKVAFVGRNGEGKTTLVRCIMGQTPYTGTLKIGHNVQIGYYAQNQAQLLDEERTVYDTIDHVATGDMRLKIRDLLGAFMFGGEASEKKVKVLSGGERSRLAMISLLLQPVNFLILDEPTNHLDMRTKDVLKEAIRAFDGTAIVVSHDRDFLNGLVSKVYEFGGGHVREYMGGIYDFLQRKQIASLRELEKPAAPAYAKPQAHAPQPAADGRRQYEEEKRRQREERKLKNALAEAEAQVGQLEAALKMLEDQMATPQGAGNPQLPQQYADLKRQLDRAMAEWEQAAEACDHLAATPAP